MPPSNSQKPEQESPEARITRLLALRAGARQIALEKMRALGDAATLPLPSPPTEAPATPAQPKSQGRTRSRRLRVRPSVEVRRGVCNTKQVTIPGKPDVDWVVTAAPLPPAQDLSEVPHQWSTVRPVDPEDRRVALAALPLPKTPRKISTHFIRVRKRVEGQGKPILIKRKIRDSKQEVKKLFRKKLVTYTAGELRRQLQELALAATAMDV